MKIGFKIALLLALAWRVGAADAGEEVRKGKFIERVAGKVEGMNETHIMLDVQNAPVNKVLSMLREMSGTPLDISSTIDMPKANVTDKNATLLNLLKKVCMSSGMTIDRTSPGTAVGYRLTTGDDLWKLPTSDMGWAMTFASGVNKHGNQTFATAGPNASETTVSLLLITERNKSILKHTGLAIVEEALTDKGESLILDNQGEPELNQYSRSVMPFSVKIKNGPSGGKLKSLKGKVFVALEDKSEDWVIENPYSAAKQTKSIAGIETLTFERKNTGSNSFSLTVSIDAGGGAAAAGAAAGGGKARPLLLSRELLQDRVVLLDGNNNPVNINPGGTSSSSSTSGGVTFVTRFSLDYFFNGAGVMPSKLIIKIPADIKAAVVPFEFKDLELP